MPFIKFPPSQTEITASPHFQANYLSTLSNPYSICFSFLVSSNPSYSHSSFAHSVHQGHRESLLDICCSQYLNVTILHLFIHPALRMAMLHRLHHLEGITMVIHSAHFPGCSSACVQLYLGSTSVSFTLCTFSKALPSTFLFQASQWVGLWLRGQEKTEALWKQECFLSCKSWNSRRIWY